MPKLGFKNPLDKVELTAFYPIPVCLGQTESNMKYKEVNPIDIIKEVQLINSYRFRSILLCKPFAYFT